MELNKPKSLYGTQPVLQIHENWKLTLRFYSNLWILKNIEDKK